MAKVPQTVAYITRNFEETDIERVWQYLEKKFGFNTTEWKKEFKASIEPLPRSTSVQEAFILFGKKRIEPLLNEVLKRKEHPTWISLLTFVLKDKISNQKRQDEGYKNRYSK